MIFCGLCIGAFAQKTLNGFKYGTEAGPAGTEWESPELLSLNKEQPRAYFFSFADMESAKKVLPYGSDYWRPLDGDWKFHWVPVPEKRPADFYKPDYDVSGWDDIAVPSCWNVAGIQKDGSLKYGVPIYCNQPVIFKHTVAVGDWKGGVMREPDKDWTTYEYRNEVGSYRRTFIVPEDWGGREVYINFDGVNSFFYIWVNGQYVGFSKNSRNTAAFDIGKYLVAGENVVAVEVYRNSDGSFLEAQDMFRLPGIFRSVYLTATSKIQVRDMKIETEEIGSDAVVKVDASIRNLSGKAVKCHSISYSVFENKLYSDEIAGAVGTAVSTGEFDLDKCGETSVGIELHIPDARLWSAEEPNRYVLVAEVKDKKGRVVETVSSHFGICKVEIKDTKAKDDEFNLAGRYFYVNGKTVKLKGVNRQEIYPANGNAITREQMTEDVMIMKRGNINHVRNSHYSCNPYWYYLCDKYGIYLEDEANIESHEYYYGKESLSHVPEFRDAHVARVMELVHSHVNHPSIVIWSLGNEAGPGKNFVEAYNAIKAFDTTRPVQYERNNDIVDMGSNQYPSIAWTREAVKGHYDMKYPFHISEYAHNMGNAGGNLEDYWYAIESTNFFCGGAIWDFVDQALYYYDKQTGERYLAYGGDFGDKPNSGMFCMNGILFPEHDPKPAYFEVKKVYQNVGVKAVDAARGRFEIFNKNYFTTLKDYDILWSLVKDGVPVKSFKVSPANEIAPRQKAEVSVPFDFKTLDPDGEYFLKVQFLLAEDKPWAKKGYAQMEEQILVKEADKFVPITETVGCGKLELAQTKTDVKISGENFKVVFDNASGTIGSLVYNGKEVFLTGPQLDAFRAPVDNDNWALGEWFAKGLYDLRHKVLSHTVYQRPDGAAAVVYSIESQAPEGGVIGGMNTGRYVIGHGKKFGKDDFKFTTNQIWTVYADGSVELESDITSNNPGLVLPRLGYSMKIVKDLENYTYYGRGPWNNYNDRMNGAFAGLYKSTVKDQFVNFPKPQSMGNREDVRWCALEDGAGHGVQFVAASRFSASALPWSALQMTMAPHPYKLPESDGTYLHLDYKVLGLGGNSCGQGGPLEEDIVRARTVNFGFIIRPVSGGDLTKSAKVSPSGEMPLGLFRDRVGKVTISTAADAPAICYTLDGVKEIDYDGPVDMRDGGTITAWYKNNPDVSVTMSYDKIDAIPVVVVYASSEESGWDDASNLVDNDPNTIWHTMYSVTVAKYPHWVDMDCGEMKRIKGFSYQPRLEGWNGDIKDYQIRVSADGKNWGGVIASGSFRQDKEKKRIMLDSPVEARYVRFTALSSQDGQDFASGAEFEVLAD